MAVRTKTRKRLAFLVVGLLSTCLLLGGGYLLRKRQIAARTVRDRDAGYIALKQRDYYTALHKIGPYLQRNPTDVDATFKYAVARLNVEELNGKHVAEAVGRLRWVVEQQPENTEARQQLLDVYVAYGLNLEIQSFTQGRTDPASLRARAIALSNSNATSEAISIAQKYNELKPDDLKMQMFTCYQMYVSGAPREQIVARAMKLAQEHPDSPSFQLLAGFACTLANDKEQALVWTRKATAQPFTDPDLLQEAVSQLDRLAQLDESLALLQRAASVNGDLAFQRNVVSRLYQGGRFADVIAKTDLLEQDLSKADVDLLAHRCLAMIDLRRMTDAQRIAAALGAMKTSPAAVAWGSLLGAVADKQSDERALLIASRAALKIRPNDPYVHFYLGESLVKLGEGDAAVREWQNAMRLAPVWGRPVGRILQVVVSAGASQSLLPWVGHLELIAREDTDSLVALALAKSSLLNASAREGAVTEPAVNDLLKLLDRIHSLRPADSASLGLKASVLATAKQADKARSVIQSVLDTTPLPPAETLLELARVSAAQKLGLEITCLDRSDAVYGPTADSALLRLAIALRDGQSADVTVFQAALAKASGQNNPLWQVALARALEATKDPRAAAHWVKIADAFPDKPLVQNAVLTSGIAQSDRKLLARSVERLGALIEDQGVNWRIVDARLRILSAADEKNPAAREQILTGVAGSLDTLTRRYGDNLALQLLLSECLYQLGQKDAAADHMAVATRLAPGALSPAIRLAVLLQSMGDFDRASPYLDQAEKILRQQGPLGASTRPASADPGDLSAVAANTQANQEAWRMIASLRAAAGQTERAIAILREVAPEGSKADLGLAGMLSRRGQLTDEMCRQLLTQATPSSIGIVAEYYASVGRVREADETIKLLDGIAAPLVDRELAHAMYLRRRGMPADSIQHLRAACAAAPDNAQAHRALISALLLDGKADEAIAAARQAAAAVPAAEKPRFNEVVQSEAMIRAVVGFGSARTLLATLVGETNQPETLQALTLLQTGLAAKKPLIEIVSDIRSIADKPGASWPMQNLVVELYVRGNDRDNAIAAATRAMRLFPADAAPAQLAAQLLAGARKWDQVIGVAGQWKERSGARTAAADQLIAQAYIETANPAEALRQLETYLPAALRSPAEGANILYLYGRALVISGRAADAEKLLEPLLAMHAPIRTACRVLATQFTDDNTAARWLAKVEQVTDPKSLEERLNLAAAWAMIAKNSDDPAIKASARKAVALADSLLIAAGSVPALNWTALGSAKENVGDLAGAETAYRESLKREPDQAIAKNNLAMILLHRDGDLQYAEALASAATAQDDHPLAGNFIGTLALVHEKAGRFDQAETLIRRAVERQPDSLHILADEVQILLSSGKTQDAKRELVRLDTRAALERTLDPDLAAQIARLKARLGSIAPN